MPVMLHHVDGIEIYGAVTADKLFTIACLQEIDFLWNMNKNPVNEYATTKYYAKIPVEIGPSYKFAVGNFFRYFKSGTTGGGRFFSCRSTPNIIEVSQYKVNFKQAYAAFIAQISKAIGCTPEQFGAAFDYDNDRARNEAFDQIIKDSELFGEKRFDYIIKATCGKFHDRVKVAVKRVVQEMAEEVQREIGEESSRRVCGVSSFDPDYGIPDEHEGQFIDSDDGENEA